MSGSRALRPVPSLSTRVRTGATRTLVVGACAAALFAGACSSSDDSSSDGTTTTAGASETTTTVADTGGSADTEDSSGGFDTGEAVLVDGEATPEHTITISADGTATPDSITVGAGELFTIKNDGAGILGLEVAGGDSVTTPNGVASTFTIAEAGTYEVTDLVNSDISATVVVE